MSRDIRAGGAFVEFFSKGKANVMRDIQLVVNGLKAFATAAAVTGGAIATGLGASFLKFASMGDDLQDAANRIGITTTRLQELTFAAGQSGAKMEDAERAMLQAQKRGLDFEKVATAIGKIEDPVKRNQAAFAAFGKSGPKIAPMLKDLEALSAKARALGVVFRPEDVANAGKMADMMGAIKAQLEAIVFRAGAAFAPLMEQVFVSTQTTLAEVNKMMQGITDAVVAGDIPLAFEIAWVGAMLEFEKFRAELLKNIAHMGQDMLKLAAKIGKEFARALLHGDTDFLKELARDIQKPSKHVKELEERLDRLLNKAAREREKRGYLTPQMPQLPSASTAAASRQSGQFGTFSAAIAAMAGRTGQLTVEQKQLDALEDLRDDMAALLKKAEEGGLVFG